MIQTKSSLLQRRYSQKNLQLWYYGVNIFKMQNSDMKGYVWTSTRQKNSMLCKQSDNMFISIPNMQAVVNRMLHQQGDNTVIMYQSCHATATVKQDDSHYKL